MRSVALVSVFMALAVALAAQTRGPSPASGAGDVLPFAATERTLPNGLKVIIVPTGFPNLVSIDIPVQTGSRNEVEPGKSGFAHFFEHLMFRGTPNTPPAKFRQTMASAGARDNASTSDDYTHYYATFAREDLDAVMGVYADMFQNLSYSESDFRTEARAILGEYNKNSAEPLRKLLEVQRDTFYQAHTYKHTTMGFIGDIENMPNLYEYSKVFFERWYRPQYTAIVVAGDVTPEEVMPIVEKHWGGWKAGTGAGATVTIPREPAPSGARYAHVPWATETLPWVTVAFPGPAFDENSQTSPAMEVIAALFFGPTSDLYKQLVVAEQKVDQLLVDVPTRFDPSLFTVLARLKNPADAVYVRDLILATIQSVRATPVTAGRLAEAKSFSRYSLTRSVDSTERVARVVGMYAPYKRSFQTVNNYYRALERLRPADLQETARSVFTDRGLIVTTLSQAPLSGGIQQAPPLDSFRAQGSTINSVATQRPQPTASVPLQAAGTGGELRSIVQKTPLPQVTFKLLFEIGSAHDPSGKEGLTALTAAMLTNAGSKALTIDQINAALYPIAGSFTARADKEMTSLTGTIHREQWQTFLALVLPQLTDPGWRQEDFDRIRTQQMNALVQDLRSNNEEELGKERLQTNAFRDTPYGHVVLGTVAGLNAITLADVREFAGRMFTRANLTVGINGDIAADTLAQLEARLQQLPAGTPTARVQVQARRPQGLEVEIVQKETRGTAISLGFPIEVTRKHDDFAALSVARAWLGEHRIASGRLYQRIREVRGINYGNYAYIEAFPRGMYQFFPDPNIARSRQLFEVWIRPVVPANAHMTLRIAVHELDALIRNGLTADDFERTRSYLMKNAYVMTARQDEQLGYALDSRWYGIGEFTSHMRQRLQALTVDQVNAAVRRHLTAEDLSVVIITKDAEALKAALVADAPSTIQYDGERGDALTAEDRVIGSRTLNIRAERVRITPVSDVFAR